jgi:outer membrane protein TolC
MSRYIRVLAVLTALSLLPPPRLAAQQLRSDVDYSVGRSAWPNFTNVFKDVQIPEVNFGNSPRLEQLLREGKLYLSLNDALALAMENNLDIAYARYGPDIANSDILRAKAGAQLRGVQTQISTLSTGTSASGGGAVRGGNATGITQRATGGGTAGAGGTGDASSFFGTQSVALDPTMFFNIDWGHFSNPQTSNFVTGTSTLVTESSNSAWGFRKGFLTGTQATLTWANLEQTTNSVRNNFNPSLRSNVTLQIRQPLIQGFGVALNSRTLRVARNNREVSDLTFKQQVIETVSRVQNLYWDLVSFINNVDSQREALRLAQKLYEDNKRRVEVGTLAPIEIVRAEAEVAAREQDLTMAETNVQLQETLIKDAISKNGLASPSLQEAQIIPTDRIEVPNFDEIQPIQDLMTMALQGRPELAQTRIQLQNRDINLRAVRNAMLPQVDLVGDVTNNGLAGQINDRYVDITGQNALVSNYFLGGLGNSLSQIFRRNFPDYSIRAELRIPLKNRQAQADMTASLLEKRQSEIRLRQLENSIRTEVKNAVIGLQQSRAAYQAAQKARVLQEQTLEAEQKKFNLGASTIFLVVQAQRDLALARSVEITAMNNYIKAKVELDRAVGRTLEENRISIEEAYTGRVTRAPDALPAPTHDGDGDGGSDGAAQTRSMNSSPASTSAGLATSAASSPQTYLLRNDAPSASLPGGAARQ